MSDNKVKWAQFCWIGLKGTELLEEEKNFILETPPAAVILFKRNYESPEQLYRLNSELQKLSLSAGLKQPLVIGVDMEGGRVARFKEPFTVWPAMRNISEKGSPTQAYEFALAMGKELRAVGVNMNFSPCTDTLLNSKNEVIGDRAFSDDPEEVGRYASSIIRGFKKTDILTCVKHFPGHGYSEIDSHEDLPIDNRKLEDITDIEAFKKALRSKPDYMMPGHLMFPEVDSEWPVPLSETWIKDILLNQMSLRSFLISDDLEMGALKNYDFKEMVTRIYNLGFHQLLFCHGYEKAKEAIEILDRECSLDEARLNQLLDFKADQKLLGPKEFSSSIIGCDEHKSLAASFV